MTSPGRPRRRIAAEELAELIAVEAKIKKATAELKAIVAHACAAEANYALAEMERLNAEALKALVGEHNVKLTAFPADLVAAARKEAGEVLGAGRAGELLGVVETLTMAATIDAADAGVKGARVTIRELRLADDLGGKGYVLFGGEVAEIEAAVDCGVARTAASGQEVAHVVISQLHAEMRENLTADPRFGERVKGSDKPSADGRDLQATVVAPRGRPLPGSGGARRSNGRPPAGVPAGKPRGRAKRSRTGEG